QVIRSMRSPWTTHAFKRVYAMVRICIQSVGNRNEVPEWMRGLTGPPHIHNVTGRMIQRTLAGVSAEEGEGSYNDDRITLAREAVIWIMEVTTNPHDLGLCQQVLDRLNRVTDSLDREASTLYDTVRIWAILANFTHWFGVDTNDNGPLGASVCELLPAGDATLRQMRRHRDPRDYGRLAYCREAHLDRASCRALLLCGLCAETGVEGEIVNTLHVLLAAASLGRPGFTVSAHLVDRCARIDQAMLLLHSLNGTHLAYEQRVETGDRVFSLLACRPVPPPVPGAANPPTRVNVRLTHLFQAQYRAVVGGVWTPSPVVVAFDNPFLIPRIPQFPRFFDDLGRPLPIPMTHIGAVPDGEVGGEGEREREKDREGERERETRPSQHWVPSSLSGYVPKGLPYPSVSTARIAGVVPLVQPDMGDSIEDVTSEPLSLFTQSMPCLPLPHDMSPRDIRALSQGATMHISVRLSPGHASTSIGEATRQREAERERDRQRVLGMKRSEGLAAKESEGEEDGGKERDGQ
ncbi:hypothetical protein KIPB_011378, partial [Kipferlia bialata]